MDKITLVLDRDDYNLLLDVVSRLDTFVNSIAIKEDLEGVPTCEARVQLKALTALNNLHERWSITEKSSVKVNAKERKLNTSGLELMKSLKNRMGEEWYNFVCDTKVMSFGNVKNLVEMYFVEKNLVEKGKFIVDAFIKSLSGLEEHSKINKKGISDIALKISDETF